MRQGGFGNRNLTLRTETMPGAGIGNRWVNRLGLVMRGSISATLSQRTGAYGSPPYASYRRFARRVPLSTRNKRRSRKNRRLLAACFRQYSLHPKGAYSSSNLTANFLK